jgi:outer membrane protein assembly factor BamA
VKLRDFHPTLLFFVLCASLLPAQTARKSTPRALPPSAFKLIAVTVTGAKRYTPEQIIAASGLEHGQTVSDDDFKKASRQLGETGAFSDVTYSFKFSGEGTKLDLQITESTQFVPARFDNFVWLPDEELLKQLRQRVPLFDGQLPMAGSLPDQISEVLQALAIEHNVQGRVDYLRFAAQDGPIEAFVFAITGPAIHIRKVNFAGATPAELATLQAASRKIEGQEYLRSALTVQAEKDLLPIYLQRGYLKARFADAQPAIVHQDPQEISVDVTFPVAPGLQYKVTQIQFADAKAFPPEKLRELIHQQIGEPANAVQLERDLAAITKLYGTRGYMKASSHPAPEMDDSQATVKYMLRVHEGDVFRMGDLDIRGFDSRTTVRLVEAWKLQHGDIYDNSYYQRFLKDIDPLLPEGPWRTTFHETPDEKDKTVDVTLRFDPNPH